MVTAIRAGLIWDGTDNDPISDGVVLIKNGTITAVGAASSVDIPANAETIDCGDEFLMPGIIDAHTHLTIIPGIGNQSGQKRRPIEEQTVRAVGNLRRTFRSGVTTARIMGEENWLDITMKQQIESGELLGPRLLPGTRALTPTNGHGRAISAFDGVDEVRKGARDNLIHGADFLKMFVTGGVSSTRGGLDTASYSREEIRVAVEEAERAKTYVAAHAIAGPGLRLAAEEGVRTLEHATFATQDDIDLIGEKDAWVVLTQAIMLHPTGIEQGDASNPGVMERLRIARERAEDHLRMIVASGINLATGTDSMHGLMAFEAECLVRLGRSNRDVLQLITRRNAECCRVEHMVGTLQAGKLADIISIRGNPLNKISDLYNVGLIIKQGERFDPLTER